MLCTHLLQWAWKDLGGFQIWLSVINHSSFLQQWPRLIWLSLKYDFICLMNCRVTDPCYFIHQLIMLLYTAANHEQHSTFVSTREIPTLHSKGTLPCHHPYSRLLPFGKGSLWIRFFLQVIAIFWFPLLTHEGCHLVLDHLIGLRSRPKFNPLITESSEKITNPSDSIGKYTSVPPYPWKAVGQIKMSQSRENEDLWNKLCT